MLANFWVRYATASGNWCDASRCLITPTYNHLWFVVYLLLYSLILALLLAVPGARRPARPAGGGGQGVQGLGSDALAAGLSLALIRWTLAPLFEINHALIADWYNHALSLGAFLFGYLTARSEPARQTFIKLRWPALIAAFLAWAAWAAYA